MSESGHACIMLFSLYDGHVIHLTGESPARAPVIGEPYSDSQAHNREVTGGKPVLSVCERRDSEIMALRKET